MDALLLALIKKLRPRTFRALHFVITMTATVGSSSVDQTLAVPSPPFSRGVKARPSRGCEPWGGGQALQRGCSHTGPAAPRHVHLPFQFTVPATALPNSCSVPNTLKKLPRNPCLDQQKQFGAISRFHHFLLESLKL